MSPESKRLLDGVVEVAERIAIVRRELKEAEEQFAALLEEIRDEGRKQAIAEEKE